MRRAARRDSLEEEIVAALRSCGATVSHLDEPGVPDLLVGFRGRTYLLEVKARSHAGLTAAQQRWHASWQGHAAIVRSVDEALEAVGVKSGGKPVQL